MKPIFAARTCRRHPWSKRQRWTRWPWRIFASTYRSPACTRTSTTARGGAGPRGIRLIFGVLEPCVRFLKAQAQGLDLPLKVYQVVAGKPIVVITWAGTEPTLPTILLNSHMDVVPVFAVSGGFFGLGGLIWFGVAGQVGAPTLQRPHGRPGQHLRQRGAGHEMRGDPVLGSHKAHAAGRGQCAPHCACGFHARWDAALRPPGIQAFGF